MCAQVTALWATQLVSTFARVSRTWLFTATFSNSFLLEVNQIGLQVLESGNRIQTCCTSCIFSLPVSIMLYFRNWPTWKSLLLASVQRNPPTSLWAIGCYSWVERRWRSLLWCPIVAKRLIKSPWFESHLGHEFTCWLYIYLFKEFILPIWGDPLWAAYNEKIKMA